VSARRTGSPTAHGKWPKPPSFQSSISEVAADWDTVARPFYKNLASFSASQTFKRFSVLAAMAQQHDASKLSHDRCTIAVASFACFNIV